MPRSYLAPLAVALVATIPLAFAQPKAVSYPGLGMLPGTAGSSLTLALGDSPPRFFYYGEISAIIQTLTMQMFDTLIDLNLETYELVPGLAREWTVSEDGTVITLQLRDGVTWHDGVPFTAEDVIFTFEQIVTNPEARAGDAASFRFTVAGESRPVTFAAPDAGTVVITLPAPSAAFLLFLRSFYIMPKHKLLPFSVEGGAQPTDINNA